MRRSLTLILIAAAAVVAVPGVATAADTPPDTTAPAATTEPAPTSSDTPAAEDTTGDIIGGGEGVDGMVPAAPLRADGEQPTMLEAYPPGAYTWDGSYGSLDINQVVAKLVAEPTLWILVRFGMIVTRTTGWVFSAPTLSADVIDPFVNVVRDNLFLPWFIAFAFLAGCWSLWLATRMRFLEAVQHVVWVVCIGAVAMAFMAAPGTIISTANNVTGHLTRVNLAATSYADPKLDVADGTTTRGTYTGDVAVGAVRRATDQWWRTFVVTPWQWGELGRVGDPVPAGTADRILSIKSGFGATPLTEAEMIQRIKDSPNLLVLCANGKLVTSAEGQKCLRSEAFKAYRDGELEKIPGVDAWVNGKNPWERAGIAIVSLLAAIPTGVLMAGLSLAILWWMIDGTVRLMILGVYALRAFLPAPEGQSSGQQVFMEYAAETLSTFAKRIVAGAALGLLIIMQAVVTSVTQQRGWGMTAFVQIVVLGVMVHQYRRYRHKRGQSAFPHPIRQARQRIRSTQARIRRTSAVAGQFATRTYLTGGALRHTAVAFDARQPTRRVRDTTRPETSGPHTYGPLPAPQLGAGARPMPPRRPAPPAPVFAEQGALPAAPAVARPRPIAPPRRAAGALPRGPIVVGETGPRPHGPIQEDTPDIPHGPRVRRVIDTTARIQ